MSGDKTRKSSTANQCAVCGKQFAVDILFCPHDGTKLTETIGHIDANEITVLTKHTDPQVVAKTIPAGLRDTEQEWSTWKKTTDDPSLFVGTVLNEQYEILSVVGTGGMSVVFLAKDLKLKREVAIKMLLPHLVGQKESLARFKQEAESVSTLSHPNIVNVYNFGTTSDDQPYLVMDYLEGKSLSDIVEKEKSISVERAVRIFVQLTAALQHAHERGVIHRDLKPSNVILIERDTEPDFVKIVDFGIAKLLPHSGRDVVKLTQTGEVFGSPLYMSPEQCRGEKLDERSDIYSIGCLMYECFAGVPPLTGDNTMEVLYKHLNSVPEDLKKTSSKVKVPSRLEAIIFKCLAKEPKDRYQTMKDLHDDLDAFQWEQGSVVGRLLSTWQISRAKRRRLTKKEKILAGFLAIAVVGCLALLSTLSTSYWSAWNSPAANQEYIWQDDPLPKPSQGNLAALVLARNGYVRSFALIRTGELSKMDALKDWMTKGQYFAKVGDWTDAIKILKSAVELSSDLNGPGSTSTILVKNQLAECYLNAPDYEQADIEYTGLLKSLVTYRCVATEPIEGDIYGKAATSFYQVHKYKKAIDCYEGAFKHWQEMNTPHSTTLALCMSRLGDCYREQHDYARAQDCYMTASSWWLELQGDSSKNAAISLARLSLAFHLQGKDEPAQTFAEKSVEQMEKAYGADSPYVGVALKQYADILWSRQNYLASLKADIRAAGIFSKSKASA